MYCKLNIKLTKMHLKVLLRCKVNYKKKRNTFLKLDVFHFGVPKCPYFEIYY